MEIQLSLAAVPLSIARKYVKKWNKKGVGVQAVRRFMPKGKAQRGYRMYIPIKGRKTKVVPLPSVTHALDSQGYRIDDYVSGIAVDSTGNRRIRIGKLLKDEKLRNEFANDPQRSAHKDEYVCVLSAHPYDVIGMSTGRRWDMTSCMRLDHPGKYQGGMYKETVKKDVAEGTIVAYAVSPNDTNIEKPHARLLIKPFYREQNGKINKNVILFRVETKVYGTAIPGFVETVSKWLRKVNADAESGIYKLAEGLYDDGVGGIAVNANFDGVPEAERVKYLKEHEDSIPQIVSNDPRWLSVIFTNLKALYHWHSYETGRGANLANQISFMKGAGVELKTIAPYIEKYLPDNDLTELAHVSVNDSLSPLMKYSKRMHKAADAEYGYDSDAAPMDATEILGRRAYWDSRWLAKISDISDSIAAANTFLSFVRENFKYTKEFRNSKEPGSMLLFKYLGLMFRIASESEENDSDTVATARKLARRFPADTYYDPAIKKLMGRIWVARMRRVVGMHTGENVEGLLCAVDKSWPAQDPELVEAGGDVIYREKAFNNLVACKSDDINSILIGNVDDVDYQGSLTTWINERPWLRDFIYKMERSQEQTTARQAKALADRLRKNAAEMDDIFNQLDDLGIE